MTSRKFFVPITIALLSSVTCFRATSQSAVATTPPSVTTIAQSTGSSNNNNLDGTWDYLVSLPTSKCSVQGACSIKIAGSIGRYGLPTDNNSVFLVNVYPTTINRGKPILTIAQIGTQLGSTGQEITYTAAFSGRLDEPGLITGRFVDVINQQGTFTLKKRS